MKAYILFTSAIIILFFASCDIYDTRFVFKNETNKTISFVISQDSAYGFASRHFSDRNIGHSIIQPLEMTNVPGPNLESWLAGSFKDSTMNLFIIEANYIGKDVDIVKTKIKRYRLPLKELQKNNWVFVYKGDK